jgi:hypothetical protein
MSLSDMTFSEFCLGFIAAWTLMILVQVSLIASRLKERFPTQAELDRERAKKSERLTHPAL